MNHPIQTTLLPLLQGVRQAPTTSKTSAAWRASCPLHSGSNKDLSIAIGNGGEPLLYCHCRHTPDQVLAELGTDPAPRPDNRNPLPA